jgi:hypothetical protein
MGFPVLVLGESGSGKTYSLKNFDEKEVIIFSVEKNRLPFKKNLRVIKNADYSVIGQEFKKPTVKTYIIDDSQYLLVNEFFDRAKETGYQKFTDIALRFRNLIHYINRNMPDDVIVYFLHHVETDNNTGKRKAKTVGKMLDEKLTVEGCFDIVLMTDTDGKNYSFLTKTDGYNPVKTPEDMFESETIPNDLKAVDTAIREYYFLK